VVEPEECLARMARFWSAASKTSSRGSRDAEASREASREMVERYSAAL